MARAIAEMGYVTPSPIQNDAIPAMYAGNDLVGQAQTGTGKTAGFGIPMAERVDGNVKAVQALVLVPTRELAQQVTAEIKLIAKYRGIQIVCLYGGEPIQKQFAKLDLGAHIIVGTPGRVIDHLHRGTLELDAVRIAVLDEADQMLDIGFFPDIRRILRATPRSRQTALFSATVPTQIKRLIYSFLHEPEWVRVGEESEPVDEVRQVYTEVAERDKGRALERLLVGHEEDQSLIFRRTQIGVDRLVSNMTQRGYSIEGLHGSLPQSKRDSVMRAFREGKLKLLVATNVASRGLDIPAVATVINFDMPDNVEEYVHRIGRTARMGKHGTAFTFLAEWDFETFDAIKAHVGEDELEHIDLGLYR